MLQIDQDGLGRSIFTVQIRAGKYFQDRLVTVHDRDADINQLVGLIATGTTTVTQVDSFAGSMTIDGRVVASFETRAGNGWTAPQLSFRIPVRDGGVHKLGVRELNRVMIASSLTRD